MKFEAAAGDVTVELMSPDIKQLIVNYLDEIIKGYRDDYPELRVFIKGYDACSPWGLSNAVEALLDGQDPEEWGALARGTSYDIYVALQAAREQLEAVVDRLKRELDP